MLTIWTSQKVEKVTKHHENIKDAALKHIGTDDAEYEYGAEEDRLRYLSDFSNMAHEEISHQKCIEVTD